MEYINTEFCSRLEDWRKWILPLVAGFAMPWMEKKYKDNIETLKEVELVDEEENIDIDKLYNRTSEIARKTGSMTWLIPMLGPVTFHADDVDKLYYSLKRHAERV